MKNDPKFIAAARELRDRWLERVNADPGLIESNSKYDLTRAIESRDARDGSDRAAQRILPVAA